MIENLMKILADKMVEYIEKRIDAEISPVAIRELRKMEIYLLAQMKKLEAEIGGDNVEN